MQLQLPKALIGSLRRTAGFDENAFVQVHQSGEQVTSVRMNNIKCTFENGQLTSGQNFHFSIFNTRLTEVPWCPHGFYLSERPSFTLDPLFHAGLYYVQEASSMFLWEILKQTAGENTTGLKVLDLCAAPGGKSTLLANYFTDGLIVANEVIRSRANILVENITKWGAGNVVVTNNDPKDFSQLKGYFDVIVIDAPCSGSGLFRKDNTAIEEWSEDNVMLCSQRQQRILADIYPALKENGILIYSTCSYSKEEDEDIMNWVTLHYQLSSCSLQLNPGLNIIETVSENGAYGYRFYPDKVKGEGFFIAAFRKKQETEEIYYQHLSTPLQLSKQETALMNDWIKNDTELFLFKQSEKILAVPLQWEYDIALLQKYLYLRKAGIAIGTIKGKELVPEHELALSLLLPAGIKKIELDKDAAVNYLKKNVFEMIDNTIKGWTIATYLNKPLGWMKVLPNRVNNYYHVNTAP